MVSIARKSDGRRIFTDRRQRMRSLLRNRGPLCLISIAVGWGASALVFWAFAEAHWQTVLWASFARLFLILAVACGSVALFLILLRSMPDDESERAGHLLRWVPGALMATAMVWLATLKSTELYPGLAVFGAGIGSLLTLEHRVPRRPLRLNLSGGLALRRLLSELRDRTPKLSVPVERRDKIQLSSSILHADHAGHGAPLDRAA